MSVDPRHYSLLAAICASLFATPLMVAGVNAALPEIGASLDASAGQLGLVGTIYSSGLAIFNLACGSFGDILGHRRVFMWGALIFGAVSAILGFVDSITFFLTLRFIQGTGAAMLSACGLALLASGATPENRATYLGFSGTAVYAGIACGPPLAGFITGSIGWQWIFWINALACLAVFLLMRFTAQHEWRPAQDKIFDWPGCVLYAIAMLALSAASGLIGTEPYTGWTLIAVFALFLGLFGLRESSCSFPVLNLSLLLKNRCLALSSLAAFVNYASFFGIAFYFSFYLQICKGRSVEEAGLILAFQSATQALCTPLASRLCNAWSKAWVAAIGAALCGLGLFTASVLALASPLWIVFLSQGLLGCGISLFSLANTNIILDSAGVPHIGQASALTGAMRSAGQFTSMVFITTSLNMFMGNSAISLENVDAFLASMELDLVVFAALNLAAIGLCLARGKLTQ